MIDADLDRLAEDFLQRVVDDVAALNVAGEKELTATVYLIGVSRLLRSDLIAAQVCGGGLTR